MRFSDSDFLSVLRVLCVKPYRFDPPKKRVIR
jgi:hypothetical protein